MKPISKTGKVAFGGVTAALSIVLLLGTLFPSLMYALPAFAGIILLPFCLEVGKKWALGVYAVVSLLSLLVVPSWEGKLLFIFFFGYYPIVRLWFDCWPVVAAWVVKLVIFNGSMLLCYFLLIRFFNLDADTFNLFGLNLQTMCCYNHLTV